MEFIAAFLVFGIGVAGMAIGVIVNGRRLQGSCGGIDINGDSLADCMCERKRQNICASQEGNELVQLAELGWPKRKLKGHSAPAKPAEPPRFDV